jgi:hypothetical protein
VRGTPDAGNSIARFNSPSLVSSSRPSVEKSSRPTGIRRGVFFGNALRSAA